MASVHLRVCLSYSCLHLNSIQFNNVFDFLRLPLQLEPIVDTISEHEKYGNNGDMFDGIARSIVNGYEAFSNLLNAIIQVS